MANTNCIIITITKLLVGISQFIVKKIDINTNDAALWTFLLSGYTWLGCTLNPVDFGFYLWRWVLTIKTDLGGKSSNGSSNQFSLKLHQPFDSILNVHNTNLSRLSNLFTSSTVESKWRAKASSFTTFKFSFNFLHLVNVSLEMHIRLFVLFHPFAYFLGLPTGPRALRTIWASIFMQSPWKCVHLQLLNYFTGRWNNAWLNGFHTNALSL